MDEIIRRALAPTDSEIAALGLSTNIAVAREVLGGGRRNALDIGCGSGKFTRELTTLFTDVEGIDPKERAIEAARTAAAKDGVKARFRVGSGEVLPWPDGHFEVVAFSNSLHHMPDPAVALKEASRVLASGGVLYVMEPVPAGNYQRATYLVNDETVVRTTAYRDLLAAVRSGFTRLAEVMYRARRAYSSFEEWKAEQIDMDATREERFDAQPDVVRSTFEGAASREDGMLAFTQVFRVDVLKKA